MPCKKMITLIINERKDLTQEVYDKLVKELPLHQIRCSCGQAGHLVRHGYYNRNLKQRKGTLSLYILRVKCQNCGRTHAILIDNIVPYEQVALDIQVDMIQMSLWNPKIQKLLEENQNITESDVAAAKSRYRKHWKERLNAMGKAIIDDMNTLIRTAFSFFHRQFMQIRRGINLEVSLIHMA